MYILTPFSIYVPVKAYTVLYKFWADIAFLHIRRIYIIYMYKIFNSSMVKFHQVIFGHFKFMS